MLLGDIDVCRLTYLAVLRHYEDLRDGPARGLVFSADHALHVLDFITRFFVHIKGSKAGQPIALDPWQRFWTACLYGWRVAATGCRRFTRAYEEVPRKNGKSTWKSPQGVYLMMCDGEPGAEIYAVATTREQAMTVFKPAFDNVKRWARRSPGMARSFKIYEGLNQEKLVMGTSLFRPLPANAENLDGLNPSTVLFDELHAQKTRDVWDVIISALGARVQPLLSAITTAGYVLDGICTEVRAYLVSVLEGRVQDDTLFGYVYTLDDPKEALTEKGWRKANPGLGTVKQLSYMQTQARQAARLPSAMANFLTKDCNVWCGAPEGWLDMTVWDRCGRQPIDPASLRGRRCFGGLDLASVRDLVALVLVFPPVGDEPWAVLARFWCPEAKASQDVEREDAAPYRRWADEGWIELTPGDVTDYDPVEQAVLEAHRSYDLVELGFDRWNSLQLCTKLQGHGVPVVEVPQNTAGMYPGSKLLERLVYARLLDHGGNPVLRYCAANTTMLHDSNGNFRPDKRKSTPNGRIDGIVATVIALGRAVAERPDGYDGNLDYS